MEEYITVTVVFIAFHSEFEMIFEVI